MESNGRERKANSTKLCARLRRRNGALGERESVGKPRLSQHTLERTDWSVSSARLSAARARAKISSADRYLSGFLMALMLRIHPVGNA